MGSGKQGAQDHVAVVEEMIGRRPLALAMEIRVRPEPDTPVEPCGLGLDIFRIAAFHLRAHEAQTFLNLGVFAGHRLMLDFGLDDARPQALARGQRGLDLRAEAFGLKVVPHKRASKWPPGGGSSRTARPRRRFRGGG